MLTNQNFRTSYKLLKKNLTKINIFMIYCGMHLKENFLKSQFTQKTL